MSIHLIYIIKNDSNNDDHVHVMYDIFLIHVYILVLVFSRSEKVFVWV